MASPNKRATKRVVSWCNREEWKAVYQELFSDDIQRQRHALDKIAVWKCRGLHKLPTAIECSAELVQAQIMDLQQLNLGLEQNEVRLSMAMAVIRFVNLITEKHQDRSYAQSVHTLAEELGLPDWLVDLRHDATHSSLPALPLLRAAIAFSLGWIQERYWEPENTDDHYGNTVPVSKSEPMDPDLAQQSVESLLMEYLKVQSENTSTTHTPKQKKETKEVRQILNKLERLASSNREQVLFCLLQDGFLIPTKAQLATYGMVAKDILEDSGFELPNELVETWKPCLKLLHRLLLTPVLLQFMSTALTESSCLRNKLLVNWLYLILKNIKDPEKLRKSQRFLNNSDCDVDWSNIVRNIVKSPNVHTDSLLKCVFDWDDCGLDSVQRKHLLSCVRLYTAPQQAKGRLEDYNEYTVKDLVPDTLYGERNESEGPEESHDDTTTWTLSTDVLDWSQYPLGTCPGMKVTCTNLELFTGNLEGESPQDSCSAEADESMEWRDEEEVMNDDVDIVVTTESKPLWTKDRIQSVVNSIQLY